MDERGYSIGQLSELSGASVRTLHHYDQIGLLVPHRMKNGYRVYGPGEVRRLQQILLYRTCGMELSRIAQILDDPSFDEQTALLQQLALLRDRVAALNQTIGTVERTLEALEEKREMTDRERFEGLKRKTVDDNEQMYGKEARRRHGDAAIDAANDTLLAMDEATWNDMNTLEGRIKELLRAAMTSGDPAGSEAQLLVDAHARWLELHWGAGAYNAEAHRGLADGYLADERFVSYYDDACGTGATQFLRDAIHALR